ncbi:MAG: hypothetical protein H0X02_11430 [Nitrosomonas sp.]|nr:hypothetical protein [Nitrosomonas sp.]
MPGNSHDQFPNLRLLEIFPLSARAASWRARTSLDNIFSKEEIVQIGGSIPMLQGLDYHHNHFISQFHQLTSYYERCESYLRDSMNGHRSSLPYPSSTEAEHQIYNSLNHEAIAYINRVGQLYYFARAFGHQSCLLRALELMPFRNKHTAHRSIDETRRETVHERMWQAMSFGFYQISINSFPVFQISNKKKIIQFHMRDDHPIIMQQSLSVLQAIHPVPGDVLT